MNSLVSRRRRRAAGSRPDAAGGPDPMAVLGLARRIARELAGGLTEDSAGRIVTLLPELLGAQSAALYGPAGPDGEVTALAAGPEPDQLVRRAAATGRAQHRADRYAAPVVADGELIGVLLASGPGAALRETESLADWLGEAVEHGRMESAREDLERAELRRMQAQISPHFLANSLSAITSLVRSDPERARELLNRFAEYARYSLTSHGDLVTVAEEFRAIEAYLQLERARFGDRLSTSVYVAPELLPVTVPVLALQPLVENAVRHGIERRPGPGRVVVQGGVMGADCVITVEDDGVGMDPAHARAVLAGQGRRGGIGLANVDRRLRALYGDEYGLMVETGPDAGTKITIRLPRSAPAPGATGPAPAAGRWSG